MTDSIPLQIAETIQTASINRHPDPAHDLNPSTAASEKHPVSVAHHRTSSSPPRDTITYDNLDDLDDASASSEDDIPYDTIHPISRQAALPPLPDLRFEQSYLASIARAESSWKVAYITIRDQVIFPLLQGTLWGLALHGWRAWNRTAQLSGSSTGARLRRWWYRTNNWSLDDMANKARRLAQDRCVAADMGDFYQNQQGAAGLD